MIREKAAPFVTWLRTAEEEESSDEEVEVVYSEAQAGNSLIVQEEKPPQPILVRGDYTEVFEAVLYCMRGADASS